MAEFRCARAIRVVGPIVALVLMIGACSTVDGSDGVLLPDGGAHRSGTDTSGTDQERHTTFEGAPGLVMIDCSQGNFVAAPSLNVVDPTSADQVASWDLEGNGPMCGGSPFDLRQKFNADFTAVASGEERSDGGWVSGITTVSGGYTEAPEVEEGGYTDAPDFSGLRFQADGSLTVEDGNLDGDQEMNLLRSIDDGATFEPFAQVASGQGYDQVVLDGVLVQVDLGGEVHVVWAISPNGTTVFSHEGFVGLNWSHDGQTWQADQSGGDDGECQVAVAISDDEVICQRGIGGDDQGLDVASIDGSAVTYRPLVPETDRRITSVAVSPDGMQVAFVADQGGEVDLYTCAIADCAPESVGSVPEYWQILGWR